MGSGNLIVLVGKNDYNSIYKHLLKGPPFEDISMIWPVDCFNKLSNEEKLIKLLMLISYRV